MSISGVTGDRLHALDRQSFNTKVTTGLTGRRTKARFAFVAINHTLGALCCGDDDLPLLKPMRSAIVASETGRNLANVCK
jgi:hypothetical protein